MKIEKFWNQAFLAALTRLPAAEAKEEADLATELCIEKWHTLRYAWSRPSVIKWKDQEISDVILSEAPPIVTEHAEIASQESC